MLPGKILPRDVSLGFVDFHPVLCVSKKKTEKTFSVKALPTSTTFLSSAIEHTIKLQIEENAWKIYDICKEKADVVGNISCILSSFEKI